MNVLHIAPTPFFADRGCHIRIRNEIEALQKGGISATLCTYNLGRNIPGINIRRICRIPGYNRLDAGFSPFKFIADFLLFFLALRTAWVERPSIIHGHLHEGALIGWAVKTCLFWRRISLIMDMQGSLSGELVGYGTIKQHGWLARLVMTVEKGICRLPDLFFCSSENSMRLLQDVFGVKQSKVVLLNDVVPDRFFYTEERQEIRRQLGIPLDRTVVLYSGSLLPGKGVGHVLEAIQELHEKRPDLYFLLVGYPIEDIQRCLDERGLSGCVHLTGQVAYHDLPQWLAVADIALDPKEESSGEASGKILHYMAAGLPVVCFDTCNNRSVLGETGYYAVCQDRHTFAGAIQAASDDCRQRRSRRGRLGQEIIRSRYSFAVIRSVLLAKYRALCSRPMNGLIVTSVVDSGGGEAADLFLSFSSLSEIGASFLCFI